MGVNNPCYHCKKRSTYCHSTCEEYAEFSTHCAAARLGRQKYIDVGNYAFSKAAERKSRIVKDRLRGRHV